MTWVAFTGRGSLRKVGGEAWTRHRRPQLRAARRRADDDHQPDLFQWVRERAMKKFIDAELR